MELNWTTSANIKFLFVYSFESIYFVVNRIYLISENGHLVEQLTEVLWRLHSARPHNIALASVCIPGKKKN